MNRRLAALAVLAGCWRSQPTEPLANRVADNGFVMSSHEAGPFNANTIATERALQHAVPQLRVVTHDLGGDSGVVFDVFDHTERLFYVVPDDADGTHEDEAPREYAKTVFAVFAMSPRVHVQGRSWQVGRPFDDAKGLDLCECWGDDTVTACYRRGTRLRVIFEAPCQDAKRDGARAMLGKPIARIMWKRELEPPELVEEPTD